MARSRECTKTRPKAHWTESEGFLRSPSVTCLSSPRHSPLPPILPLPCSSSLSDLPDEIVRAAQRWVKHRAYADKAARYGKVDVVLLGLQRDDAREDRRRAVLVCVVTADVAGTQLNFLADLAGGE